MTRRKSTRRLLRPISRRRTLQGLSASVGVGAMTGCGDDTTAPAGDSGESTGAVGTGGDGSTSGDTTAALDESSSGGGSTTGAPGFGEDCGPDSDLPPEQLLAPIETIVVVMMENRSFDHFFGAMLAQEQLPIDGLTGTESNDDAGGRTYPVFLSNDFVVEEDPPHGWDASHAQWNAGANDGFVREHILEGATEPGVVMGYHDRSQLPTLWTLASNFVVCDRWFASVMGPTQPNRFFLHLATSEGFTVNPEVGQFPSGIPSVFDRLSDAGISNVYYNSSLPFVFAYGKTEGVEPIGNFFEAAAAGTLPQFSVVEPVLTALNVIGNDDHPPADITMGQAFLATVYEALAQSPQWDNCLLIITYDEHGGFYDHVSPPTTFDERPEFQQLGFRVPAVVVGPHVRRGCVNSIQLDHVSVAATITRRWGLAPLNERVTMTNDVSSAVNPDYLDDPQPPVVLPQVTVRVPDSFTIPDPHGRMQHQIELVRTVEAGRLSRELDRRWAHDETMRLILDWGQRLGAIKLA
jgi:phospholipase C